MAILRKSITRIKESVMGTEPPLPIAEPQASGVEAVLSLQPGPMEPQPDIIEQQPAPVDSRPIQEAPSVRPMDQEKMGYVSPSYTISRSVTLNPQVLAANRCVGYQQDSREMEFYKVLRTKILQRTNGGGGNTVMVTSALPGEGKTLTAINLAFTFAKEFKQTALLVDCDLRQQRIHQVLGFPSEKGVVDYLLNDCPIQELFVWPGVEKLTVISGGKTVKESSELLGSPGMKNLVTDMKNRYPDRYVFFDVPPLLDQRRLTCLRAVCRLYPGDGPGRANLSPGCQQGTEASPRRKGAGSRHESTEECVDPSQQEMKAINRGSYYGLEDGCNKKCC